MSGQDEVVERQSPGCRRGGCLRKFGGLGGISLLLICGQIGAAEGDQPAAESLNLIQNGGLEETVEFIGESAYRDRFPGVTEIAKGFTLNVAYPGKLTVVIDPKTSHGGAKYVRLEPYPQHEDADIGFVYGRRFPVPSGGRYAATVWAKGRGQLALGVYCYANNQFLKSIGVHTKTAIESDAWAKHEYQFTVPDGVEKIALAVHVVGTVELDDVSLVTVSGN